MGCIVRALWGGWFVLLVRSYKRIRGLMDIGSLKEQEVNPQCWILQP